MCSNSTLKNYTKKKFGSYMAKMNSHIFFVVAGSKPLPAFTLEKVWPKPARARQSTSQPATAR